MFFAQMLFLCGWSYEIYKQLFAVIAEQYQESYEMESCLGISSLTRDGVMEMQRGKMKRTSHAVDKTTDLNFMRPNP